MAMTGKNQKELNSMAVRLALTSASAIVAETSTYPIDITKTRLQLHVQSSFLDRKSAIQTALGITKEEGLRGIYKGLSPALIRHIFYTPFRIVSYEHLRTATQYDASVLNKALVGGLSGVLGQVVASPADLVKVRMQADGRMANRGLSPRYTGVVDAFAKIVRSEGVGGLWRGVLPNVQRAFLVNMGELACYDQAKHMIVGRGVCEDNVYAHTLASVMSGLSATALSCPADVVKTRMMNQVGDGYRNSVDCLVKTVRKEGVMALWKGFFPTWARLGPWQFVFWVSYERFRSNGSVEGFFSDMGEARAMAIRVLGFLREVSEYCGAFVFLRVATPIIFQHNLCRPEFSVHSVHRGIYAYRNIPLRIDPRQIPRRVTVLAVQSKPWERMNQAYSPLRINEVCRYGKSMH